MIEHAAEIRQEFLVMHDAAPGAETEFQPASGGVMIGTGPQRCAPVEPGEGVRIGTIAARRKDDIAAAKRLSARSEEHTSELQSLMRISYAVFCCKKKNKK